jgi:putative ABC transport system ATP-binding protein
MEMLSGVTKTGTTIIIVTHSDAHASRADRVAHMLDGRFIDAPTDAGSSFAT